MDYKNTTMEQQQINISMIIEFIRTQFSNSSINVEDVKMKSDSYNRYINVTGIKGELSLDVKTRKFNFINDGDSLDELMNIEDKPTPDDVSAYVC